MKVLLIYPPNKHMLTTNVPSFVEEEKGCYPPLGLLYVAAYAEKYTDHRIQILDAQAEQLDLTDIEEEIKNRAPDIVGIQTMTFTLIDAILTAKIVKKVSKNIHVNLGGPHVSIYPNETINLSEIDSLTLGEGEIAFTELINSLSSGRNLKEVPGIVYKEEGRVVNTGVRDFIQDLDALPFPARHLTLHRKYFSLLAKRSPITTMITSRGCPYRCLFCDRPHLGKKFRFRSTRNVVDEIEECIGLGIREFFFYDDTFTVNRKRALNICREILDRDLKIGWDIRTRVDLVDDEMLEVLKQAGCERIHFGVEAGTPEILEILRKGIKLDEAERIFKKAKELGITTLAYFMIGSPTETREQILQTFEFARKIVPDYVHLSVTTPFPATDLYRWGLEKGLFECDYWKNFAMNPEPEFVPELWEENLSRKELVELLELGYRKFYLRPKYVLGQLRRVSSWTEFKRKAHAGLKVLLKNNPER